MFNRFNSDQWLGLFFVVAAALIIFVWIPLDTETLFIHKERRQLNLGDGLAPTIAAILILGSGIALMFCKSKPQHRVSLKNVTWLGLVMLSLWVTFLIMRYTGPILANLIADTEYRLLRVDFPWKYLGYVLGGTSLVTASICLTERQFTWRGLCLGFGATLVIAFLYGVPFDTLQLPPNGDV